MKFVIFAVLNTAERFVTLVLNDQHIKDYQNELCNQTGKEWVWADTLQAGQGVFFESTAVYFGFTGKGDTYTPEIAKVL